MMTMPDFAIHARFAGVLPEAREEGLLDLVPGTVISHLGGDTIVAVPVTVDDLQDAARNLSGWAATFAIVAGAEPVALSIDPLEENV